MCHIGNACNFLTVCRHHRRADASMPYAARNSPSETTMKNLPSRLAVGVMAIIAVAVASGAQAKPRARDLGVPFDGTPGQFNAITDVKGVEVGHTTLVSGSGKLKVGTGPVRTGVTAILPRGK